MIHAKWLLLIISFLSNIWIYFTVEIIFEEKSKQLRSEKWLNIQYVLNIKTFNSMLMIHATISLISLILRDFLWVFDFFLLIVSKKLIADGIIQFVGQLGFLGNWWSFRILLSRNLNYSKNKIQNFKMKMKIGFIKNVVFLWNLSSNNVGKMLEKSYFRGVDFSRYSNRGYYFKLMSREII